MKNIPQRKYLFTVCTLKSPHDAQWSLTVLIFVYVVKTLPIGNSSRLMMKSSKTQLASHYSGAIQAS